MISTPLKSKTLSHTGSSSLPSRSHPLIPQFNEHLSTLKSDDNDSTYTTSLPLIAQKLHLLENLFNCLDDLLLLPHTHQVFAREWREKWVDEILEGYLGLVDACSLANDFVSHSKQCVLNLLSILRRKRDSDDLSEFVSSRKTIKKGIQKLLRNVGGFKNKPSVSALDKDEETIAIISMLKETECVTLELFEALLSSMAGAKSSLKSSGWCLVSRLMKYGKIPGRYHKNPTLEFGDLDKFIGTSKCETGSEIEELREKLREMDLVVGEVEERLEWLFKRLIKSRVLLLNMQSQYSN